MAKRLLCWVTLMAAAGCAATAQPPAADSSVGEEVLDAATAPDAFDFDMLWQTDAPQQCPGGPDCVCVDDSDCSGGHCVESALGLRCSWLCSATCPPDTVCRTDVNSGEPVLYCAPVGVRQCAPCVSSADCVGAWGAPAVCASAGEAGSFCASACQTSAECPAGYACEQLNVLGSPALGCVPTGGLLACECSQWAKAASSATSCEVVSDGLRCPGARHCAADGLTACVAIPGAACLEAGCAGAKDGVPCEDGDPCTQAECQGGSCVATVNLCGCQSAADCPDDGNLCNGSRYCDKSQLPYQCKTNPASVVQCPGSTAPCSTQVCEPATGKCSAMPLPLGSPCDDGAACTLGDYCDGNACKPGTVTCSCSTNLDCLGYEDGNLCNGTLFCNKVSGQCQINPASVVACPTGLDTDCRQTVCQPATGQCVQLSAPATKTCDDGNPCSASEHCDGAGNCASGVAVCPCQQDADCAASEDGDLCNGTLYCDLTSATCMVNPKTVVLCPQALQSPCAPVVCEPTTGQCVTKPLSGGSCAGDDSPCTAAGTCADGSCVVGPNLCQCQTTDDCAVFDDANPCNGLLYCDTAIGRCAPNLATVPFCQPSDQECTQNICNPSTGSCHLVSAADGEQCDDGEPCTKNDQCQSGACSAGLLVCACLADSDCAYLDDGDPCNGWWFCNHSDGAPACAFLPQPAASCVPDVDATQVEDAAAAQDADKADAEAGGSDAEPADVVDAVPDTDSALADVVDVAADTGGQATDAAAASDNTDAAGPVDGEEVDAGAPSTDATDDDATDSDGDDATDTAGGCAAATDGTPCDDGNACTAGDACLSGVCEPAGELACPSGTCTPVSGCVASVVETCDGVDNDSNGTTDDVVCGGSTCTCSANGSALCGAACTVCPDPGDVAIALDVASTKLTACAHEFAAWGVTSLGTAALVELGDGRLQDNSTGLQWQAVMSADSKGWLQARDYCDELVAGGQADWRLPTVSELASVVDYLTNASPVSAAALADTPAQPHWTVTPGMPGAGTAWYVDFATGAIKTGSDQAFLVARCVRATAGSVGAASTRDRFTAALGVVTDQLLQRQWQQAPPESGGTGGSGLHTWAAAGAYCDGLTLGGHNDWRLPTLRELSALSQRTQTQQPLLDSTAFANPPTTGTANYWSSTNYQSGTTMAWYINANTGVAERFGVNNQYRVRCIR